MDSIIKDIAREILMNYDEPEGTYNVLVGWQEVHYRIYASRMNKVNKRKAMRHFDTVFHNFIKREVMALQNATYINPPFDSKQMFKHIVKIYEAHGVKL